MRIPHPSTVSKFATSGSVSITLGARAPGDEVDETHKRTIVTVGAMTVSDKAQVRRVTATVAATHEDHVVKL
tara:strand:- start:4853 stop:5068 length:216 start_codon:yes stop_codon:yes gene_type:complete